MTRRGHGFAGRGAIGAMALFAAAALRAEEPPLANGGADARAGEEALLILRNDRAVVGVSPRLGGRVALYRRPDGENVLASRAEWWADPEDRIPAVAPGAPYRAYNGHITWLGPQIRWWAGQDWDPVRRDKVPPEAWPPNPHWETAPFRVVEHTPARVVLEGPRSDPVTGWALAKTVELRADGSVDVTVEAVNASDRPRAWSIWTNTRVHGDAPAFFPVAAFSDPGARVELTHRVWSKAEGHLASDMTDGWFGFHADAPVPANRTRLAGKANATPRAGVLAAFAGADARTVFWKSSDAVAGDAERAPGHSGVELYHNRMRDPADPDHFAELEFHGPYTELAPGETAAFRETWRLLDYDGPPDRDARVAFLEAALKTWPSRAPARTP